MDGYNVEFDIDFIREFFKKCEDDFYDNWINNKRIDPLYLLYIMDLKGLISLPNYRLKTVCKHYNIKLEAHDAFSDIKASIKVMEIVDRIMMNEW